MTNVVTFGEIMLRLSPPEHGRITDASCFDAVYGGSEANVAASLKCLDGKIGAAFVTKLPADNPAADAALNSLRRFGVDVSDTVRGGGKLGLYYLENGASVRPSRVIYDRANSAFALSQPSDYDWDAIFSQYGNDGGAKIFHWSGITPALGGALPSICKTAAATAKKHGFTVTCDLNYRETLWQASDAAPVLTELMEYTDILIVNEEHAAKIFGVVSQLPEVPESDGYSSPVFTDAAKERALDIAHKLCRRFDFKAAALTQRRSISASDNVISAVLRDGGVMCAAPEYRVHIVDRVGGGDAFTAGLLYCMTAGMASGDAVCFAAAASALKHTIRGDVNTVGAAEVEAVVKSGGSGRILR